MKTFLTILLAVSLLMISGMAYAKKEITILWYLEIDNPRMIHIKKAIDKFERENDIKVSAHFVQMRSTDDFHKVYLRVLASRSGKPDVIQIDKMRIPEFAELGYIADITSYFPPAEVDQYIPNDIKEITWNKRRWAFPFFTTVGLVLYRKDLLAKYNFDPPKTWKELIDIAAVIQQKEDVYGYVGQMAEYEGLICNVLEFLWSNGAEPGFVPPSGIDQARAVEAIQLMVDIVNKYRITPENQLRYKEAEGLRLYAEGRALFVRQWTWPDYFQTDYSITPALMKVTGVLPMPAGPSGKHGVSLAGGWALAVNSKSKNLRSAVKLIKRLTDEENQKYTMLNLGGMPSRKKLYKNEELLAAIPWMKDISVIIGQRSKIRPRSAYYVELSMIMQREFHLALKKTISAEMALKRVESKIDAFLKSTKDHQQKARH